MSKRYQVILRICFVGVFSALSFVLTAFSAIPYPGGAGYFNFADALTILCSLVLGPIEGALIGIIGGAFGDLYGGYFIFIPFTIVAKGLLGLFPGLLYNVLKNHKITRFSGLLLSPACMVLTYFIAYYTLYGLEGCYSSLFDLLQGYGGALIAAVLFIPISKVVTLKRKGGPLASKGFDEIDDKNSHTKQEHVTHD